jgi:DNA-binding transcriptional MocR family regulator
VSLAAMKSALVAYLGMFSKTLSPALQVGYLIAPPQVMPAL